MDVEFAVQIPYMCFHRLLGVTQNSLRTLKAEHAQKRKDMARAVGMI